MPALEAHSAFLDTGQLERSRQSNCRSLNPRACVRRPGGFVQVGMAEVIRAVLDSVLARCSRITG
jgi:hypothetical protein